MTPKQGKITPLHFDFDFKCDATSKEKVVKVGHHEVLLSLGNAFFRFALSSTNTEAINNKLDFLDRQWKQYVSNWNSNSQRRTLLKSNTFLLIVDKKLKEIEKEAENEANKEG